MTNSVKTSDNIAYPFQQKPIKIIYLTLNDERDEQMDTCHYHYHSTYTRGLGSDQRMNEVRGRYFQSSHMSLNSGNVF
jgi:hypothetical protein